MDSDVSHIRTGVAGNVKAIKTGLPGSPTPLFEWAVLGNGMLCTAQIPVGPDGAVVAGGIEEQARQVFELFTQERQAIDRARGGLGLGLAIVKNLMTMHSGSVTASSKGRDAGSTFTIRLPTAMGDGAQPDDRSSASQLSVTTASALRMLIVDDNADAAEMLEKAMIELGCETRIGYDGASALRIVESFEPQLAILDIGLPLMDGYELAGRLRQRAGAVGTLRLVALTGYGQKVTSSALYRPASMNIL
jgi:CheY-like chemotaxis protein